MHIQEILEEVRQCNSEEFAYLLVCMKEMAEKTCDYLHTNEQADNGLRWEQIADCMEEAHAIHKQITSA